jgi:hypothetical protein
LPARLDPDLDPGSQDLRHTGHFPWRCNLSHFWEAGLRGGWGAGGAGEVRGGFLGCSKMPEVANYNVYINSLEKWIKKG